MDNANHDDLVGNAEAAQIICGGGPGSLSNLQHWRRRYPVLDDMSLGTGKTRRWRRRDLEQFLLDLPKHRSAKRLRASTSAQVRSNA